MLVDKINRLIVFGLKLTLAIGTKLQAIISDMALEIQERHAVIQGMPLVNVSDRHFWLSRPALVLHIIHFILFQVHSPLIKMKKRLKRLCIRLCPKDLA